MLADLRLVLAACPPAADRSDYRAAVVDENTLLKPTMFTRKRSFKLLAQLYGLKPGLLLFRALRDLWDEAGEAGQPLVALLCALAPTVVGSCFLRTGRGRGRASGPRWPGPRPR
jgi:hypothetical protein